MLLPGTYLVDKDKKKGPPQYGPRDWVRPVGISVKALAKELIHNIVKACSYSGAREVKVSQNSP